MPQMPASTVCDYTFVHCRMFWGAVLGAARSCVWSSASDDDEEEEEAEEEQHFDDADGSVVFHSDDWDENEDIVSSAGLNLLVEVSTLRSKRKCHDGHHHHDVDLVGIDLMVVLNF